MRNAKTVLMAERSERQKTPSARLTIQLQPIDALQLDPQNPREHSRKQIAQIAESIRAFGFNVPVLIDGDNKIIAGHFSAISYQHGLAGPVWEQATRLVAELIPPGQRADERGVPSVLVALARRGQLTLGSSNRAAAYPKLSRALKRVHAAELLDQERGTR